MNKSDKNAGSNGIKESILFREEVGAIWEGAGTGNAIRQVQRDGSSISNPVNIRLHSNQCMYIAFQSIK